jgi:hypothetical protein
MGKPNLSFTPPPRQGQPVLPVGEFEILSISPDFEKALDAREFKSHIDDLGDVSTSGDFFST